MSKFLVFSGIGVELGVLLFVAIKVAEYLNKQYTVGPLIYLFSILAGLAIWFIHVIILIRRIKSK